MNIIERIKIHCLEEGITQSELAKRTGIHPVTVSNLFRGKTKKNAILILDDYLESYEQNKTKQATVEKETGSLD